MTVAEAIITFFPFIFAVLIFFIIFSRMKKLTKMQGKAPSNAVKQPVNAAAKNQNVSKKVVVPSTAVSKNLIKNSSFGEMEDKAHDWLAQQIAYENSMKSKIDDMFALRKEHAASCDAGNAKNAHMAHCDANGVDIAQYR